MNRSARCMFIARRHTPNAAPAIAPAAPRTIFAFIVPRASEVGSIRAMASLFGQHHRTISVVTAVAAQTAPFVSKADEVAPGNDLPVNPRTQESNARDRSPTFNIALQ